MHKKHKAFLKWAGGKTRTIDFLLESMGKVNGKFIEPFVGSAVVSLNVKADDYIIADNNLDLVNLYNTLVDHNNFIEDLKYYFSGKFNNPDSFYQLREQFNTTKDIIEKSLLFIYLNRHCFNGLCRYNKSGKFNVPFGRYVKPYLPEKELLLYKKKLSSFTIIHDSFENVIILGEENDVIYNDPPYVPLSKTASFVDYSVNGFNENQQIILAGLAEKSKSKVLISNHDTAFTRKLYSNADIIKTKKVNRYISGKKEGRNPVYELLAIYNN